MKKTSIFISAAAVVGLVAAGCGDDGMTGGGAGADGSGGTMDGGGGNEDGGTGGGADGGTGGNGDGGTGGNGDGGTGGAMGGMGGMAMGGMGGMEPMCEPGVKDPTPTETVAELCTERCKVTTQLGCGGDSEDQTKCEDTCESNYLPACESEYKALIQCQSVDCPDGFTCFGPNVGLSAATHCGSEDTAYGLCVIANM